MVEKRLGSLKRIKNVNTDLKCEKTGSNVSDTHGLTPASPLQPFAAESVSRSECESNLGAITKENILQETRQISFT